MEDDARTEEDHSLELPVDIEDEVLTDLLHLVNENIVSTLESLPTVSEVTSLSSPISPVSDKIGHHDPNSPRGARSLPHTRPLVLLAPRPAHLSLPTSLPGASVRRVRKIDPNRARNERVREVHELRTLVEQFTAQLNTLQLARRHEYDPKSTQEGGRRCSDGCSVPLVWEAICEKQIARRIDAETENFRLKRTIEERADVIKRLQRAIKKSLKLVRDADLLDARPSTRSFALPFDSATDAAAFAMMITEVDAAYYEIDDILELNNLTRSATKTCRGTCIREGELVQSVDICSCHFLPFDATATANVVWRFYSGLAKHRGPLYFKSAKVLEMSHDTVIENLGIELTANATRADFHIRQVVRRYVEPNRVIIVWMGMVEPVRFANKPFSSYGFRSKGYIVCEPLASFATGAAPTEAPFTRIRRCKRVIPYATQRDCQLPAEQVSRNIRAVMDFMTNLDNISPHIGKFQDELMQASIRQRQ